MNKKQGSKQKQILSKFLKGAQAIIIGLALFLIPTQVFASTISDIDQQINETQTKLNSTSSQRKTLQGEVAYFDNQMYLTQLEINKINANINKIQSDIKNIESVIKLNEELLLKERNSLSEIITVMYEEGQVSNIELIAKSSSFSEFLNRSEYLESINLKIKESTDKIIKLKEELNQKKQLLETDRKTQEKLKSDESSQKNALSNQRYSKNLILQETKGQESAFKSLMSKLYAQRAAAAAASGQTIGGSGSGGYPYTGSCGGVDPWLFYKCQCTSYASWYWNSVLGKRWTNTRPGQGDAHNWYNLATDLGYSWDYSPRVNDIAVWPLTGMTPYGHVAIVTAVSGSTISVSEYNWTKREAYGTRTGISYSGLKFIH